MKSRALVKKVHTTAAYVLFTALAVFLSNTSIVAAQSTPGSAEARQFVATLNSVILIPLIGLLMGVAFLVFLIGCVQYVLGANNPTAREQGVRHITYGIIGMVIMVSAWAILSLIAGTFGLDDDLRAIQQP